MKKNLIKLTFMVILAVAFMFITFSSCQKDTVNEPNPDSTFVQKVDKILTEQIILNDVAGVAIFARDTKGNEAWTSAGMANVESDIPMNRDTKLRIASISKTFLAVTILQLIEEGKLELDDNFSNYLPDSITTLFTHGNDITIFQLLGHTSGLYDFEDDQFMMILSQNPTYHWTPMELLTYSVMADSTKFFPPGTEYHYSNTNYILLGLILEQRTGISMQQNIRDRILTPLDLNNTFSGGLEQVPQDNYAIGYQPLPDETMLFVNDQTVPLYFEWGHGHMISTVHDLWIFFDALTKKQLFQEQSTLDAMLSFSTFSENTYGLGIANINSGLVGHSGSTMGFISLATINPQNGSAIIFCFNQHSNTFMKATADAVYKVINN